MFKKLLQSPDYELNMKGDVLFKGKPVNLIDDYIELMFCGKRMVLSRTWLGLIAHYELKLTYEDLLKVKFVKSMSKVIKQRCGFLMQIQPPIEDEDGFRLIPGFTKFSIDKNGNVKSIRFGKVLKSRIGPYGYPYVDVYDPDKNKWRSVNIHILLARAFVVNPDPEVLQYVNHKDGVKTNNSLENLEWMSSKQNNIHAVDAKLRNDNLAVMVRDILTGIVNVFESKTRAATALGLGAIWDLFEKRDGKVVPKVFNRRYEIKLVTDRSDWHHSLLTLVGLKKRDQKQFQCKNIETGVVLEAGSLKHLSELSGVNVGRISFALKSSKQISYNGFLFREKTSESWPEIVSTAVFHKPRKVKVTDLTTGLTTIFASINSALKKYSLDKRTLKNRLSTGKPYGSFVFEEVVTA